MANEFGKDAWIEMFRAVGLDDATMRKWHVEFESKWPEAHERFLVWLGLPAAEVKRIREGARR
jgi:MerR family transcriptional regulator, thiopeptide resistance regulator